MAETIKLQVVLARAGLGSRRACEKFIEQGRVTVNQKTASIGQRVNPDEDSIAFDGKALANEQDHVYFLINKPAGVVSTAADELDRATVLSVLPDTITQRYRLYPVGRLDIDSEGLLLLTNDGQATHRLTHPSFGIEKTYEVLLDREPSRAALNHLRSGVKLKDGFADAKQVRILQRTPQGLWLSLTIAEGRNRQIRRMMERVGYEVQRLIRVRFGSWHLSDLENKTYKQLESL